MGRETCDLILAMPKFNRYNFGNEISINWGSGKYGNDEGEGGD